MRRKVGKGECSTGDALCSREGAGVSVAVVEIALEDGELLKLSKEGNIVASTSGPTCSNGASCG